VINWRNIFATLLLAATIPVAAGHGAELSIVTGSVGNDLKDMRTLLAEFRKKTGHTVDIVTMPSSSTDQFAQYRLWLAARDSDVDVYQTDIIWAPQLATHFVDLGPYAKDLAPDEFKATLASQTVDDRLVALPMFADAPALYYRKDLLDKYGKPVPKSWSGMAATANAIMDGERKAGNAKMWGFVFQGASYEGLTCDALEWIASHGGGHVVEPDGTISVDNPKAEKALEQVKSWIGSIAPPGVLSYQEEESRGVWQSGNAVFMRNWPYAYALGNGEDSPIKGKFDAVPLPAGEGGEPAATLGGWALAVSKYSKHRKDAIELALFLTSAHAQKYRALESSRLPTLRSLYDDPEIGEKQPIIPRWKKVLESAIARPTAATGSKYNEVSSDFWTAVHNTLSGEDSAAGNLELLKAQLADLGRGGW
jgi:trehalose/maltose transport system substrate-binding protein